MSASFFVKHPPNGDTHSRAPKISCQYSDDGSHIPAEWTPTTYGIEPEYAGTSRELAGLHAQWEQTSNPLCLLEAFRISTNAKLYPPLWCIHGLQDRFNAAHGNKKLRLSLDRAFGLSGKGFGKGAFIPSDERGALRARNRLLCMGVFKLEACGLSRLAACKALSSLLNRLRDGEAIQVFRKGDLLRRMDITAHGIKKAIATLEDEFSGEREAAKDMTSEDKQATISQFRSNELPRNFRVN